MPELLRMPEVAANTGEAVLTGWPVPENQPFAAGDVIAIIETAKAAVDIEAETDGVIIKTLVTPGSDVQVGDAIALIAKPGEKVEDIDAVLGRLGIDAARNPSPAGIAGTGSAEPAAVPAAAQPTANGRRPRPTPPPAAANGQHARVFASPLARRVARDAGIAVESLTGSGPDGRIVRRDVEQAIARQKAASPAPTVDAGAAPLEAGSTTGTQPRPASVPFTPRSYTDVPPSKLRKAIAQRLTESKRNIPHFYLRGTARVDRLLALRAELNAASRVKISINDLVVKAVAQTHMGVAGLNVIWTDTGVRQFDSVDLGIAVATDSGLVTPVLRSVERATISSVAMATRDFATRAKQGGLKQAELEGGCATITNLGVYGTEEFAAIINPPQSSILAIGAARQEPVVTAHGEVRAATIMRVTLSVDHRAIDGALAAQWMQALLAILEEPLKILV